MKTYLVILTIAVVFLLSVDGIGIYKYDQLITDISSGNVITNYNTEQQQRRIINEQKEIASLQKDNKAIKRLLIAIVTAIEGGGDSDKPSKFDNTYSRTNAR